jgi:hypothetical protein
MNITVKVDDVALDTIVAEVFGYDDEGETYQLGNKTLADLVAGQITDRLVKDPGWAKLAAKVTGIRDEVIRERVTPAVEEALHGPICKTNHYGEPVHGQTTTLRELIAEEAARALTAPVNRDSYRDNITLIQKTVRDEVQKAFAEEIAAAVKQARASVAGEIGNQVAAAVTNAMKGR